MLLAALLLAAAGAVPPADAQAPPPCFDWAVVAQLDHQTYLGVPRVPEGEISLESIFRWDVRVRLVVVGKDAPRRTQLVVRSHTKYRSWAARRMVLFLRKGDDGRIALVERDVIDRGLPRSGWREEVNKLITDRDLMRCDADRPSA